MTHEKSKENLRRLENLERQKIQKLADLIQKNKAKQDYELKLEEKKFISGASYQIRQVKEA